MWESMVDRASDAVTTFLVEGGAAGAPTWSELGRSTQDSMLALLSQSSWLGIVVERNAARRCGLPGCLNCITVTVVVEEDADDGGVINNADGLTANRFCSSECHTCAVHALARCTSSAYGNTAATYASLLTLFPNLQENLLRLASPAAVGPNVVVEREPRCKQPDALQPNSFALSPSVTAWACDAGRGARLQQCVPGGTIGRCHSVLLRITTPATGAAVRARMLDDLPESLAVYLGGKRLMATTGVAMARCLQSGAVQTTEFVNHLWGSIDASIRLLGFDPRASIVARRFLEHSVLPTLDTHREPAITGDSGLLLGLVFLTVGASCVASLRDEWKHANNGADVAEAIDALGCTEDSFTSLVGVLV